MLFCSLQCFSSHQSRLWIESLRQSVSLTVKIAFTVPFSQLKNSVGRIVADGLNLTKEGNRVLGLCFTYVAFGISFAASGPYSAFDERSFAWAKLVRLIVDIKASRQSAFSAGVHRPLSLNFLCVMLGSFSVRKCGFRSILDFTT